MRPGHPRGRRSLLALFGLSLALGACAGDKEDTSDFFDDQPDDEDDTTDPAVSLDAPTAGETVSGAVTWAATASDNDRVESVALYVDHGPVDQDVVEPWGGSWDSTAALNGEHQLAALARDPAGNTTRASSPVIVSNEGGLAPSAVEITSPTSEGSLCGTVTVQTSVSADVVQVAFALDGDEQEVDTEANFYWEWDTTAVPDGDYIISATASDAEGKQAVDTLPVTIINDDAVCDNLPEIAFTTPLDGEYVRGAVDVSVETSDDLGVNAVTFYVDGGLLLDDTAVPFETTLDSTSFDDGTHTLRAIVTDTGGQSSAAEIGVFIDNEAPALSIEDPSDGETLSGDLSFTVSATDNLGLDHVSLSLDGELLEELSAEPFVVQIDTTTLDVGAHSFEAYAINRAGNESIQIVDATVDNPPSVVFTAPTDSTVYGTVSVAAEATDDERVTGVTLYQDGEVVDSTSTGTEVSTTIETCDFDYGSIIEFEVIASDPAGNLGDEALTLTVDQPIQVEIDGYSGALDYLTTLSASVSDDQSISSVVWSLDGTSVASTTRSSGTDEDCFDCGCTLYTTTWSTATASEGSHTLTVTATNAAGDVATDSTTVSIDFDHDGDGYDSDFYGGDDCDDEDTGYNPAVAETCDGLDNDCDGEEDEDFDADGDRYFEAVACEGVYGDTDCDDTDADVSPGAAEDCDSIDDDCDGHIDNLLAWTSTSPVFGASSDTLSGSGMAGSVYLATSNATITGFSAYLSPGTGGGSVTWAIYVATSSTGDYTLVDSNTTTPSGTATWYSSGAFDVDLVAGYSYLLAVGTSSTLTRYGDKTPSFSSSGGLTVAGYISSTSAAPSTLSTDPSTSQIYYQRVTVETPSSGDADLDGDGVSTSCDDCDDDDAAVSPDITEICDEKDNDCDGAIDEAADADSDGDDACTDCDDGDDRVYTGGSEVCDGVDNDCDGSVDDDPSDGAPYYTDDDDDGYGVAGATTILCGDTSGYAPVSGDCDDDDATSAPDLSESCDGADNDCDGTSDEDFDRDGDGYGAGAGCDADTLDCDDTDAGVHVGATETCDSEDDDCDGVVDDDPADGTTFYADSDGDGYGSSSGAEALCALKTGYSRLSTDCDDAQASVHPGATETCNEVDDDCDGAVDDGLDRDGDGYASCSECDDSDADVSPDATEVCGNDVDDDCDGFSTLCQLSGTNDMGSTGYQLSGGSRSDYAGWSVHGGGDQNGDGVADVLVASYLDSRGGSSAGTAYIVPGGSITNLTLGSSPSIELYGEDSGDRFGYSVAYVGDLDGDGYDELLAGGIGIDDGAEDAGAALLVEGPTTSDTDMRYADARLYGADSNQYAGSSVALAGDLNDDGELDLLVGAYASDDGTSNSGTVYGMMGPISSASLETADLAIYGSNVSDYLGTIVVGDGDTNGDGYSDLLLGAKDYTSSDYGAAFVVLGPATGTGKTSAMADATLQGSTASDYAGQAVEYGDVNGDGYDDVLMGAPGVSTTYTDAGAVSVFLGPVTASTDAASATCALYGAATSAYFGASVSAGDLDEDGVEDLLVGAPYESDGGTKAGVAYVFYGPITATATTSSAAASYVGEDGSDYFGWAVDIGGDMDADGGRDLLIGAYGADGAESSSGAAYVILQ